MIRRMNQTSASYGPALYRILEAEWTRLGLSRNAWCREKGINAETIARWLSKGSDPGFEGARQVALLVERPMIDVLVEIGVLSIEEAGVPPKVVASLDDALRLDPTVSEYERAIITEVRKQLRGFSEGTADTAKIDLQRKANP